MGRGGGAGPVPLTSRVGMVSGIDDSRGGSGGTGPEPSTISIEFGGSGGTGPLPSTIRTGLLSGIDDSRGGSGGVRRARTATDSENGRRSELQGLPEVIFCRHRIEFGG